MKDVPYENGSSQCGQEASPNVQVAGPGQAGVGSNAIEGHKPNDQNETWKNSGGNANEYGLAVSGIFNYINLLLQISVPPYPVLCI